MALSEFYDTPTTPGDMGTIRKSIDNQWKPGAKEATSIYNQGLPALDPNNYLANTMSSLNAGNPYASQLGAFDPNNPALNALGGFDPSNPYTSQVGNFDPTNAGLQGLQNFDPTNSGLQSLQNFDPTNQGIGGFDAFTQGGINPYAQKMFDLSADQIQDQINSQFGNAGQGSSSGNLNEQISQLGDYGTKFFGNLYENDQNRALQATQGRSDAYQNQNQLGLNALGQYATGLQNQNQLGLSALSDFSQGSQAQNALGLDALGTAQSGWGDSTQADLAARGMGIDAYGAQDAQRLSALQAAGGMQQNALNSNASFLPGMLSQIQQQPYSNLDAYSQIVSRLTGSSPQSGPEPAKASAWDKAIGVGSMLGGLGRATGIKGLFG